MPTKTKEWATIKHKQMKGNTSVEHAIRYAKCPSCGEITGHPAQHPHTDCKQVVEGLVWSNPRYRHTRKLVYVPGVSGPYDGSFAYYGKHPAGSWVNLWDELLEWPDWIQAAQVPIVRDKSEGKTMTFKAILNIDGEDVLLPVMGAVRPGLYNKAAILLSSKGERSVTVFGVSTRVKYARSPRSGIKLLLFNPKDRVGQSGLISPRWAKQEYNIYRWALQTEEQITGEPITSYVRPESAVALYDSLSHSLSNSWCNTPVKPIEWNTDARPMYEKIRAHLDWHGFDKVRIRWVQKRHLIYSSDGRIDRQAGVLLDAAGHKRTWKHRPLLWDDECWALQLSAKQANGNEYALGDGLLFVTDDLTFIATFQCLRIGQSLAEYSRGINLYSPNAGAISLADFIAGPLSDFLDRKNKLSLIRDVEVYKPKPDQSPSELQATLLAKLNKTPGSKFVCPNCEFEFEAEADKYGNVICPDCEWGFSIHGENDDDYEEPYDEDEEG